MYALGVFACLAVWLFFFILPHWTEYSFQVGRLRDESKVKGLFVLCNICMFALTEEHALPRYTVFLTQALVPLGLFSLWVIHMGSLIWRGGFRVAISKLSDLERFALICIIMFLPYFVDHYSYSGQRYHIFLVPATILGVGLLGHRRNEELSLNSNTGSYPSKLSILIGSVFIAMPFFLYLRIPIAWFLLRWTNSIHIGDRPGLSIPAVATLATLVLGALIMMSFPFAVRALRGMSARVGVIARLLLGLLLSIQLIAIGNEARRVSYTTEDATVKLGAHLGDKARVIEGYTLVFGTKNRYLTLLDRRWAGYTFFGKGLIPSFRPTHIAILGECTEIDFAAQARDRLAGWGGYVPGTLRVYRFCHTERETIRFALAVGEVTPSEQR